MISPTSRTRMENFRTNSIHLQTMTNSCFSLNVCAALRTTKAHIVKKRSGILPQRPLIAAFPTTTAV
jgi:hypothetical protein